MRAIALAKPAARLLVAFLVLALCWPGAAARAQEGPPADWSGTWDTLWRDGGARLILEQDGRTVTGSYPLYSGRRCQKNLACGGAGCWLASFHDQT